MNGFLVGVTVVLMAVGAAAADDLPWYTDILEADDESVEWQTSVWGPMVNGLQMRGWTHV